MWIERLVIQDAGPEGKEHAFAFDRGCTVISVPEGDAGTRGDIPSLILDTLFGGASLRAEDGRIGQADLHIRVREDRFVLRRSFENHTVTLLDEEDEVICEGKTDVPDGLDEYRSWLTELLELDEDFWKRHRAGELRRELERLESLLERSEQVYMDREEILQNFVRFEHLSRERTRLENALVELRDERDRTRKYVEAQEMAKARLAREYPAFLAASNDLQAQIQGWIDAEHRLRSVQRDLQRISKAVDRLSPGRTIQKGGMAAIVLGVLSWLICQGSGAPMLGLLLFPFFSLIGFGMVWYMDRSMERVRVSHQREQARIERELAQAEQAHVEMRDRLGELCCYETPEAIREAFRGYMEIQEKLERARSLAETYRSLSAVQNDYEQVFSELQVLDTQTRDLVAQARYLSGMDASPEKLEEKTGRAREESAEAKSRMDRLGSRIEKLRGELRTLEETPSGDLNGSGPGPLLEAIRALNEANGKARIPLVVRDVFGGWDEGALAEARTSLRELVETGGQAILLCSDARVTDWADSVIHVVPGDDASDIAA